MEGFGQLFAFSLVMLFGSYIAGSVPLFMSMSEEKLHLVSIFGAGLLLGVALTVIIPEGLQTLIKAYELTAHEASPEEATADHSHSHHHSHDKNEGLDSAVALSLLFGFIFMLLVDQLASSRHRSANASSSDPEASSTAPSRRPAVVTSATSWTTTLGLVVHAAADGIAMGAASATHQTDIELIVFLAIMLHKAPAAFGLVTFLMHEGLERIRIRKHLMIFALSAPAMAVVTFMLLVWNGSSNPVEKMNTFKATGIAMLFSAGTFLYVATVHVLPEITNRGESSGSHLNFTKTELVVLVFGSVLPLFLTLGHHH